MFHLTDLITYEDEFFFFNFQEKTQNLNAQFHFTQLKNCLWNYLLSDLVKPCFTDIIFYIHRGLLNFDTFFEVLQAKFVRKIVFKVFQTKSLSMFCNVFVEV